MGGGCWEVFLLALLGRGGGLAAGMALLRVDGPLLGRAIRVVDRGVLPLAFMPPGTIPPNSALAICCRSSEMTGIASTMGATRVG